MTRPVSPTYLALQRPPATTGSEPFRRRRRPPAVNRVMVGRYEEPQAGERRPASV